MSHVRKERSCRLEELIPGRVVLTEAELQSPEGLLCCDSAFCFVEGTPGCALFRFRLTGQGGAHKVLVELWLSLPFAFVSCIMQTPKTRVNSAD